MGLFAALPKPIRTVVETALTLVVALGIAWLGQAFVVKPYRVPTASMVPTLEPGDRVLADRLSLDFENPGRGQIVVFHPPHCKAGYDDSDGVCTTPNLKMRQGARIDDVRQARDRPARRDGVGHRRPRLDQGQGQAGLRAEGAVHHGKSRPTGPAPQDHPARAST